MARKCDRLTQELMTKIAGAVQAGCTPRNAMQALGIPKSTHDEWLQKGRAGKEPYVSLVRAIESAQAESFQVAEVQLMDLVRSKDFKAITWFLERRDRQQYKPVTHTEISGPDNSELQSAPLELLLRIADDTESE